jgi:hypothetical protein
VKKALKLPVPFPEELNEAGYGKTDWIEAESVKVR